MSFSASGLSTEEMESASSVSSECRRGLRLFRCAVFRWQMGSSTSSEITRSSSSTLATPLRAFISRAEAAPSRLPVLPVTTRPSGSTMAPAGAPVVSSFSSAAERAGERLGVMAALFISRSIFSNAASPLPVRLSSSAVAK